MHSNIAYFGTTPFAPRAMPRHYRGSLDFKFEELPLFRSEDGLVAGRVDGECEVSFTSADDHGWEIVEIYLVADNGRNGAEAIAKRVCLRMQDDQAFWGHVCDAILDKHRDRIVERIGEELEDDR